MLSSNGEFSKRIVEACQISLGTSNPIEPNMPAQLLGLMAPYANESDISKYWQPVAPPAPPPPAPVFPSQLRAIKEGAIPNAEEVYMNPTNPGGIAAMAPAASLSPEASVAPANLGHKTGSDISIGRLNG